MLWVLVEWSVVDDWCDEEVLDSYGSEAEGWEALQARLAECDEDALEVYGDEWGYMVWEYSEWEHHLEVGM